MTRRVSRVGMSLLMLAFGAAVLEASEARAAPQSGAGATAGAAAADGETPSSAAVTAFERFKRLSGVWKGRSTKGWEDQVTIDVIAGGSAVRSTSFDAHPGETMLTLYHMDGERLMLTHYCVARNQPRMVASRFEDGGKTIAFDFLDATNLSRPGAGHMHSSIVRFQDDDHFTSRWTWFQDGKESWMEEIVYERQR